MRRTASTLAATLVLAAASAFGQSQTKIYGFLDAQFDANYFNNDVTKQFLSYDTFGLALKHANIYFDFKPNEKVSALVEIGFLNRPRYKNATGSQGVGGFTYKGDPITKDQAKDLLLQAKVASELAKLPADQRDASRDAITAQARPVINAMVDQMTATPPAGPTETDKLGLSVERAYFDVNISDPIKLRFGKFITPAGIWNVDHGSPVVLTVRQPIQTTMTPIFPESQTGVMGFGTIPLGDHDFNYSGYITGGRIDGASNQLSSINGSSLDRVSDLAYGGHVGVKLDVLKSISLGGSFFNGARKQKYQRTEVSLAVDNLQNPTDVDMVDVYTRREREIVLGGDAKVEVSNLLVQGEINYSMIDNENEDGSTDLLGWYGLVAWNQPVNDVVVVTPYAMYEQIGSSVEGAGSTGAFQKNGLESISTIVGGVNVSLFTNLRVKTEYTRLLVQTDSDTWPFENVEDDDLTTGIWSTQVSVAF